MSVVGAVINARAASISSGDPNGSVVPWMNTMRPRSFGKCAVRRSPGRPGDLRTAHLPKLRGRIVFIHGTTDPFGSPEEIEAARALITAPTTLILTDGGHDLGYRKPR